MGSCIYAAGDDGKVLQAMTKFQAEEHLSEALSNMETVTTVELAAQRVACDFENAFRVRIVVQIAHSGWAAGVLAAFWTSYGAQDPHFGRSDVALAWPLARRDLRFISFFKAL